MSNVAYGVPFYSAMFFTIYLHTPVSACILTMPLVADLIVVTRAALLPNCIGCLAEALAFSCTAGRRELSSFKQIAANCYCCRYSERGQKLLSVRYHREQRHSWIHTCSCLWGKTGLISIFIESL